MRIEVGNGVSFLDADERIVHSTLSYKRPRVAISKFRGKLSM